MVSQVYTYSQIHQVVYFKYVAFYMSIIPHKVVKNIPSVVIWQAELMVKSKIDVEWWGRRVHLKKRRECQFLIG